MLRPTISILFLLLTLFAVSAAGQQTNTRSDLFRIGTGGSQGTYFIIGSLIADGINNQRTASNAVNSATPEPLVIAQRSNGSVANVSDIAEGLLESALVQADVANWAQFGNAPADFIPLTANINAIASLYLESVHLVAASDSDIFTFNDLTGKRVSIDEVGSGTQLDVRMIFDALALDESGIQLVYLKPADAISRLREGTLDAFFSVAGYPVNSITELIDEGLARIVSIDGPGLDNLVNQHSFLTHSEIPINTYKNKETVNTLAVAALWVVDSEADEDTVYHMTKGLWSSDIQTLLQNGHPKGKEISLNTALLGLGIPLHPGASRYYRENGIDMRQLNTE